MLSLKHILVATDFSAISIVALRHALGIARRYHSNVSLLHVIDPAVYGIAGPDGISAETEVALRDAERVETSLRSEGSLEGLRLDFLVEVGPVWKTIADEIKVKRPGALVLGTRGRTGLRKLARGSVAGSAFREAPCLVLTVGPKALRSKSSGAEAKGFLIPTDLSPESMKALPYGISLARGAGSQLTLLHVLNSRVDRNHNVERVREAETTSAISSDHTQTLRQWPVSWWKPVHRPGSLSGSLRNTRWISS
jgi:nucleotide-binding universal stress UspA family protein